MRMSKKLTSRDKQAIATKKKILMTGIRLINDKGFEHVSVEEIAKSADVSVGTFYYYYPSKKDLITSMPWKIDAYFEKEVVDKLDAASCVGNIKLFFYHYAKHTQDNGWAVIKTLFTTESALNISEDRFLQMVLLELLQSGQESGEISTEIPHKQMMRYLLIVARGVALDWAMSQGESDIFGEMEQLIGRVLHSFLAESTYI